MEMQMGLLHQAPGFPMEPTTGAGYELLNRDFSSKQAFTLRPV